MGFVRLGAAVMVTGAIWMDGGGPGGAGNKTARSNRQVQFGLKLLF